MSPALLASILRVCRRTPTQALLKLASNLSQEPDALAAYANELDLVMSKECSGDLRSSLRGTRLTNRELSIALLAANQGIACGRKLGDVELVWTGPELPCSAMRQTLPQILEMIGRAEKSIVLTTFAAFKAEPVMKALQAAWKRGVELLILVEFKSPSGGQLTADAALAFPQAIVSSGCLWYWPMHLRPKNSKGLPAKVHAKCLVIDDAEALISSANLTDDAMLRNIEAGVRVASGGLPKKLAHNIRRLATTGMLRKFLPGASAPDEV